MARKTILTSTLLSKLKYISYLMVTIWLVTTMDNDCTGITRLEWFESNFLKWSYFEKYQQTKMTVIICLIIVKRRQRFNFYHIVSHYSQVLVLCLLFTHSDKRWRWIKQDLKVIYRVKFMDYLSNIVHRELNIREWFLFNRLGKRRYYTCII